jgi:IS5 family transposase
MLILVIIPNAKRKPQWEKNLNYWKRVVRELERKLPEHLQKQYETEFSNYKKALTKEQKSKDKIYSLHEPQAACIAKGKAHKAYEFGSKVCVV